jgi:photosystem II stability/assembly factor-like uncharacterized protein
MTDKRRMYVGTETGVRVFTGEDGEWRAEAGGLAAGRIEALVAAGGAVYAGVRGSGVFQSRDGGSSWERVLAEDVRSLAADPANPEVIYAGTEPVRLYRSNDGGRSWAELEGLQRMPDAVRERWWFPIYPHEAHVLSIWVAPGDSRQVYAGLEHGGILRSDDGGLSWEDVSAGIEYLDIHMVASDFRRESLAYAATARGFYRSDDFGRDWQLCGSGLTRDYMHDFVVLPGARSRLFMTTANGTPPNWLRETHAESAVFRSDDEGESWRQLGGGLPASMELMLWNIAGDPEDAARLYAAAGDWARNLAAGDGGGGEVWASVDGGDSWRRVVQAGSPVNKVCVQALP